MTSRTRARGAAATEFAALIPIYMLLTVALITIGDYVMIRQQVVMGVRYRTWLREEGELRPQGDGAVTFTMFKPWRSGPAASSFRSTPLGAEPGGFPGDGKEHEFYRDDVTIDKDKDRVKDPDGKTKGLDEESPKILAYYVLSNKPQPESNDPKAGPCLKWCGREGQYGPISQPWLRYFFGRSSGPTPKAKCFVLWRDERKERRVYKPGENGQDGKPRQHPIEDYWRATNNGFQITSDPANRFYSPAVPDPDHEYERGYSLQPGNIPDSGSDPGIWNERYRLGGGVQQEYQFYKQMLGY